MKIFKVIGIKLLKETEPKETFQSIICEQFSEVKNVILHVLKQFSGITYNHHMGVLEEA